MRNMKARLIVVCITMVLTGLLLCQQNSLAKIGPETIVGIWLLDDNNKTEDSSKNGNDGEIKGKLELVDGQFGKALQFPGVNDSFIEVPPNDSLDLVTFSFTMWVKLQDTGNYQAVLIKTADGLTENYSGYIYSDKKVFWTRFTSGGATKWGFQQFGVTVVTDDKWHHLAGTYDLKSVKSYVDGVVEANAPFEGKPDKSPGPLTIGICTGFPYVVKGIMDDVGLFNVALSEDDIKGIMNNGLAKALAVTNSGKLTTVWGSIKK